MDHRTFWLRRARAVVWRHGLARWLELFLPALVGVAGAGAVAVLVARGAELRVQPIYIGAAAAAVLAAVGAAWFSRRRTLSLPQALVRLEDQGRLHTRLSAAGGGVGEWPAPMAVVDHVRWNGSRLVVPLLAAVALLLAARWVPLPALAGNQRPHEQPIAWSQVETWLETMQESRLVEPEALDKLQARLDELRNQPPEQWYQQSSLEAGDTLRQQTEAALRAMQRDLKDAERVAGQMEKKGPGSSKDELKKMDDAMQQALQSLRDGELPLNQEMLKELKDLQNQKLSQLTPEQMQQLKQRLSEGQKVCEKCVGGKQPGEKEEGDERVAGPGGGGEHAPLTFKKDPTDLKSKQTEKLESDNLDQALPAETLAVTASEHEVDKAALKVQGGGAISSTGEGGAAVWKETMIPKEREVLQRYFK